MAKLTIKKYTPEEAIELLHPNLDKAGINAAEAGRKLAIILKAFKPKWWQFGKRLKEYRTSKLTEV